MSFNLIRNARVFFTTNVDAAGRVIMSGATPANTVEIQVLDGLSYSQNNSSETVTISEGGETPVRGQRSFNTALEPVDFSISTYMRPADGGVNITAEESVLWNALLGVDAIGNPNAAWTDGVGNATCVVTNSQSHQLQPFGLIIAVDGTSYAIDNCALDTASIDFGLESLATIAWAGKGIALREVEISASKTNPVVITGGTPEIHTVTVDATGGTFTVTYDGQTTAPISFDVTPAAFTTAMEALSNVNAGDVTVSNGVGGVYEVIWNGKLGDVNAITTNAGSLVGGAGTATVVVTQEGADMGTAKAKVTTAPFIANKLSTLAINKEINGTGKSYTVALTGGNLQISNNITYLTPANLGVVNQPVTYFTGTRAITGSINAYLRSGSANTSGILSDMLDEAATAVDPAFEIQLDIGGSSNATRVELDMPATVLSIPTISTDQVVSTTINFTAQGFTGSGFDIGAANEIEIRYFTTNV